MVLIKNLVIATVGLVLAIMLYSFVKSGGLTMIAHSPHNETPATTTPEQPTPALVTYSNATLGITFQYPQDYVMKEVDLSDLFKKHSEISLTPAADVVPSGTSTPAGEAPPGITIDAYQNDARVSLNAWLEASSSNYYLGGSGLASTTVGSEEALQYHWSGLYEAETTAFLHRGNIVAITVTYISPEDANVAVYRQLLQTLQMQ